VLPRKTQGSLKNTLSGLGTGGLIPVISAIWEVEIRKIAV
jgi:hypothetical protein